MNDQIQLGLGMMIMERSVELAVTMLPMTIGLIVLKTTLQTPV